MQKYILITFLELELFQDYASYILLVNIYTASYHAVVGTLKNLLDFRLLYYRAVVGNNRFNGFHGFLELHTYRQTSNIFRS